MLCVLTYMVLGYLFIYFQLVSYDLKKICKRIYYNREFVALSDAQFSVMILSHISLSSPPWAGFGVAFCSVFVLTNSAAVNVLSYLSPCCASNGRWNSESQDVTLHYILRDC